MSWLRLYRTRDERLERESSGRLLRGAVANDGQCAVGADNRLRWAAAVDKTPENKMKVRIAGMLSKDDEIDLVGVELERRVRPSDHLLAILLFDVLTDGEDTHVGQDRLRCHHLDPPGLGGLIVARKANNVNSIIGQNESASRRVAFVVDLDRDCALSSREIADMKPPVPALTSLSCRIGSPRRNATRVIDPSTSLSASGFTDFVIMSSETSALAKGARPSHPH